MRLAKNGAMIVILLMSFSSVLGCATGMIPGSSVESTDENEEIWNAVLDYRRAIEERDVDSLVGMVSSEYFDNASTTDSNADDYGFDDLRQKYLPILRKNIKKVRMDLRLTEIVIQGDHASVRFEQNLRFLFSEGGKDGWRTTKDYNELVFVREDTRWKIIAGL